MESDDVSSDPDVEVTEDETPSANGDPPADVAVGAVKRTRAKATAPKRKRTAKRKSTSAKSKSSTAKVAQQAKYPRHSVEQALRIPRAMYEQNAGNPCTVKEAAAFTGATSVSGNFNVEVSSAKKYGFLASDGGKLVLTQAPIRLEPR